MENSGFKVFDASATSMVNGQADSPPRILVVDDERDFRQLATDVLTGSGYEVEAVNDGAAGWEALLTYDYDLIITDNIMPRMQGIEMIEKLRAASMTIPVIMATGLPPTHEFVRRPWLKPDITLEKPFSNEDLLGAVKKLLGTVNGSQQ
jgi:DNA-binding response OmpR family regulator